MILNCDTVNTQQFVNSYNSGYTCTVVSISNFNSYMAWELEWN